MNAIALTVFKLRFELPLANINFNYDIKASKSKSLTDCINTFEALKKY